MPHSQHRSIWRRAKSPSPPPLKKKPPGRWCGGRGYGNTWQHHNWGDFTSEGVITSLAEDNMDKIIVGISVFIACDSCVLSKEQIQRRNLRQKWQFPDVGKAKTIVVEEDKAADEAKQAGHGQPVLSCLVAKLKQIEAPKASFFSCLATLVTSCYHCFLYWFAFESC